MNKTLRILIRIKKKITFGAFEMDISGSVLEKDQILSNLPLKIIAIYANR